MRIHTGPESARAAESVGAKAYAMGQDIHFAAGHYDPSSAAGRHLLAHEVAHTVQQAGTTPRVQHKLDVSQPGDAAEIEADRAADAMVSGQPAAIGGGPAIIARDVDPNAVKNQTAAGVAKISQLVERAHQDQDRAKLSEIDYALANAVPAPNEAGTGSSAGEVEVDLSSSGIQVTVATTDVPVLRSQVKAARDSLRPPGAKPTPQTPAPQTPTPQTPAPQTPGPSTPAPSSNVDYQKLHGLIMNAVAAKDVQTLSVVHVALQQAEASAARGDAAAGSSGGTSQVIVSVRSQGFHIDRSEIAGLIQLTEDNANPPPPGPVKDKLPGNVDLTKIGFVFTIPGGITLSTGTANALETQSPTQVSISVSQHGIHLQCVPPLRLWVLYARNSLFHSADVDFATGAASVNTADDAGILPSSAGALAENLKAKINDALAGTPIKAGNYNPVNDPDLPSTLRKIADNLARGDGKSSKKPGPIGGKDITGLGGTATITMKTPVNVGAGDGAVSISGGGSFNVSVSTTGSLADAQAAGGDKSGGDASKAKISAIAMTSDAVTILSKGKPVAKLHSVTVAPGGAVTIDRIEVLGAVKDAATFEEAMRLIAALAVARETGRTDFDPQLDARFVPGLTKAMVEHALTPPVQQLLRDNAHAIPGVDLTQVFGM